MKRFSYRERDYAFGQAMLTLRTAIGLTQAGLAEILGVSRRAVSEWEAGSSYPKAKHLTYLIEIGVQHQTFPVGREAEEIRRLWKAAHQKALLDEQWLAALLKQARSANAPSLTRQRQLYVEETRKEARAVPTRKELIPTQSPVAPPSIAPRPPVPGPRLDWGDALTVSTFYGREQELSQLFQWIVQEHCRVVSVLGMGGIGKSALSIRLMHHMIEHFEIVLFRSLRDAPSCEALLDDCLQTISPQPLPSIPASLERRISQLLDLMRKRRIFLVLDNLEGLLDEGDIQGRFRPGFEEYDLLLLRRAAETIHQSCLLLTSREKPAVLRTLEGKHTPVRFLRLSGLEIAACQQIFAEKAMSGPSQKQVRLAEIYAGNPLALKIVAETIVELFAGQIGQFLAEGAVIFGSIAHLQQLDLSQLSIRGAYLQGVEMQDASLAGASIRDTIFTASFDAAWAVAVSRQGQYWAAGSRQGEVRVWSKDGRRLYLAWQAHTDTTFTLAFSPDERTLVTAGFDGTVKLWDLDQGALLWTGQHLDVVRAVVFSPTGHLLASGANDGTIYLWDPASGTIRQTLTDEGGAVYSLAWSPDGRLLASGSLEGSIRLWQIQGAELAPCVQVLCGHTNWVVGLAFAPDGVSLVSGSWDNTVKLWDVASGRLLHTLTGHTKRVHAVAWSPDGRTIASAGFDGIIWLWDVGHESYRAALHGHTAVIYTLAFTPESRKLLSGSEDGTLGVWDVERRQCVQIMQGYAVALYHVAWNPAGTLLATAGSDWLAIIWDATNQTPPKIFHGHRWTVFGVAWSPDGRWLASSGRDNAIRLWDPSTGISHQILRDPDYADTIFYSVTWSPDGHLLASGSYMRGVQVWNVETGQRCWVGSTHPTRIRRVAWSPDGNRLATSGDDRSLCLWRACDGTLLARWQQHHSGVMCVAWSPDGKRLASGGSGRGAGELFVWDANSGEIIRNYTGDPGSVFALTWSKDGKRLVTGRNDGTMRWWDVNTWKILHIRQAHDHAVYSVQVSPDGDLVASCGDDSSIKLWDLETTELVQTLRRDRPYERLNITGAKGLTAEQKATLCALGAYEEAEQPHK